MLSMLPDDLIDLTLRNLCARDLACLATASRYLVTHVESVLRQRTSVYVHPVKLPVWFSTWALYLARFDWITWKLNIEFASHRKHALYSLCDLEPTLLALYAGPIVRRLTDEFSDVRILALKTLCKLEPTTLAQHAGFIVDRLFDEWSAVRITALQTLCMLEPTTLALYADAIAEKMDDEFLGVRVAALRTLRKLDATARNNGSCI